MIRKARKSIANFKLREGQAVGCTVTLRRDRMWEFFDRLVNVSLPRVRDFKGLSAKAFDGRGNFSLGIREQIIFPEIEYDKVDTRHRHERHRCARRRATTPRDARCSPTSACRSGSRGESPSMMTDPVADLLARIRNAGKAHHPEIVCPSSQLKLRDREGALGRGLSRRRAQSRSATASTCS